jgi:hypothetical protein
MRKKLNILFSVGELFYSNQIYRLGVTLWILTIKISL